MRIDMTFLLMILLVFIGCDNKVVEEQKKEEVKADVVERNVTKEEKTNLLKQLGFDLTEDKIVIDMNRTSHFFDKVELQMEEKEKEIEKKIENADINMTKGMGIELEGDQIGIDLNKTRNMLQQINILMKDIFLDINTSNH